MRVLSISANREEINMRTLPLGLACVAAATKKKGHDVALVDLMEEGNPSGTVHRIGFPPQNSQPSLITAWPWFPGFESIPGASSELRRIER